MSVELTQGARFGRYRIDGLVARGGMGAVYRATDIGLDRPVALKVILPELARQPGFRERFEREARAAARLDHPNVVPVHEAGEHDGVLFLAMRFVEGTDLRRVIADRGALEPRVAARIVAQVGAALDAAHSRGLIHRDVKPANVLLTGAPGAEHVYLSDFGLARRPDADDRLTSTGQTVGTLDYMAPEQIENADLDARVDVYALGCLLFQALTARVPYPGRSEANKIMAHLLQPPPSVTELAPSVPPAFDAVVARAMAKPREERFASAGELGAVAIAAAEAGEPAGAPQTLASSPAGEASTVAAPRTPPRKAPAPGPVTPVTVPTRERPRRGLLALAGLGALAVAALAVLALSGALSGEPKQPTNEPVATDEATATDDSPATEPDPTVASPPPGAPDGAAVSEQQATRHAGRFENAFADEDLAATSATLAPDVELVLNGGTVAAGRDEVGDQFAEEFAGSDRYQLDVESVQATESGARVEGRFSQDVSGITVTGAVAFDLVPGSGGPLIERIETQIPG